MGANACAPYWRRAVQDIDSLLPDEVRARLRAPVDLGAGARARVMQRVRATAASAAIASHPRGIVRPSVIGALLAASFVAAIVTGEVRSSPGGEQATLADTIAMHFAVAEEAAARPPVIDRARLVAAADETRNAAPRPLAGKRIRRD